MRLCMVQMTASDDPAANLADVTDAVAAAAAGGAELVLTPEVTNCVSLSRAHQQAVLCHESDDPTLAGLRAAAAAHGVWLLIGSLALKTGDPDGRLANRSFLVDPAGAIVARYDKLHMFDVDLSATESFRESRGYRPGERAVLAPTPFGPLGMTICYDLRFPALYRDLAQAGARILTVPSAFSAETGPAHWETLLRARAIECAAYVLAPAQTGVHPASAGKRRRTWGHSLAVDPWGQVIADGGDAPGLVFADIDPDSADDIRRRLPSLYHDTAFEGPR